MSPLDSLALDGGDVVLGLAIAAASIGLSIGIGTVVVVRMPVDYFEDEDAPESRVQGSAAFVLFRRVAKNLLGLALIIAGLGLSIPGVPGQGVLTILVGLVLLDLRAKRRLERRLVRNARLLAALNAVRARFHRAPLRAPRLPPTDHQVPDEEQRGDHEEDRGGGPLPGAEQQAAPGERTPREGPSLDGGHSKAE